MESILRNGNVEEKFVKNFELRTIGEDEVIGGKVGLFDNNIIFVQDDCFDEGLQDIKIGSVQDIEDIETVGINTYITFKNGKEYFLKEIRSNLFEILNSFPKDFLLITKEREIPDWDKHVLNYKYVDEINMINFTVQKIGHKDGRFIKITGRWGDEEIGEDAIPVKFKIDLNNIFEIYEDDLAENTVYVRTYDGYRYTLTTEF